MSEKYYKVAESDLVGIADAIRLQKKSEKKYYLKDFAKIIKAMLVLPSGLAETNVTIKTGINAIGILPTIYKGNAKCDVNLTVEPTCIGVIPEYDIGYANSTVNMSVTTNAVGVLTE